MTHTPRLPRFAGLPLAVGAGLAIPVQGRINGALGVRLNDGIASAVVGFGFLMSFQQAMNGTATVHYGSPVAATLVNFVAGSVFLWIALAIKVAVFGPGNPLPAEWWYYLGGPMGCVFIGLGALLVRSLGVLVTGLGMIAGQLLGSLGLDLLVPAPGSVVAPATVLGTLLTLAAIILATLPWPRGAFRRQRPVG